MTIPSGLKPAFKKKALKLRQEFQELNYCDSNNEDLDRRRLEKCLVLANELIHYYDEIYSDVWNNTGLEHEIRKLNPRRTEFVNAHKQYEDNPKSYDVFKIKRCLELAHDFMTKYDGLLNELKIQVFK